MKDIGTLTDHAPEPSLKPTIIIGGLAGAGKTTLAAALAAELRLPHVSSGNALRELAQEMGFSNDRLSETLLEDPRVDAELDRRLLARACEGGAVIESRVLAWLVPKRNDIFRVYLTCDADQRLQRVYKRTGATEIANRIPIRDQADAKRWKTLYGIDLEDLSVFDVIIDTSWLSPESVFRQVLERMSNAQHTASTF